jgi:hypothetical protein
MHPTLRSSQGVFFWVDPPAKPPRKQQFSPTHLPVAPRSNWVVFSQKLDPLRPWEADACPCPLSLGPGKHLGSPSWAGHPHEVPQSHLCIPWTLTDALSSPLMWSSSYVALRHWQEIHPTTSKTVPHSPGPTGVPLFSYTLWKLIGTCHTGSCVHLSRVDSETASPKGAASQMAAQFYHSGSQGQTPTDVTNTDYSWSCMDATHPPRTRLDTAYSTSTLGSTAESPAMKVTLTC